MVYMAANNTLAPYAKIDINEMESIGSSSEVAVVVEAEFDPGWATGVPTQTVRGLVAADADDEHLGSWYAGLGNRDMADPANLRDFISWAARSYPARHYALVIWSHGQGWKDGSGGGAPSKGVINDGTADYMSVAGVAQAISDSGVPIEVVNFDACLMGMYEVAYGLKDCASYLVFSEEVYPANGDPYGAILRHLALDPGMDGRTLAQTIVEDSLASYRDPDVDATVTRSLIDMSVLDELHTRLCVLAGYLVDHMDAGLQDIVEEARSEAFAYGYPANIDLGDFLQKLHGKTGDAALIALIEEIIGDGTGDDQGTLGRLVLIDGVYLAAWDVENENITNSRGVAVYLPSSYTVDLAAYALLASNQPEGDVTWIDFLNGFLL
jgi:hypothetical protein